MNNQQAIDRYNEAIFDCMSCSLEELEIAISAAVDNEQRAFWTGVQHARITTLSATGGRIRK